MSTSPVPRTARFEGWRLNSVYGIVLLVFVVLLMRMVNLQILQGEEWIARAIDNYTVDVSLPASRGIIYDRN